MLLIAILESQLGFSVKLIIGPRKFNIRRFKTIKRLVKINEEKVINANTELDVD